MSNLSITRLEQIAYGSVRQSAEEGVWMARELLALQEAGKEPVAWEVKGILCHTLEEAQLYVGEPEPLFGAPQSPDMPTDDERLMEIEGISVVNLPHEFYSDQGVVVQLEKVMAALAVNGVEYKRSARVGEKANILSDAESEEHVIRQYRTVSSPWIQCSKQAYERKKANGLEVRVLHAQPQNQPQNIPEIIPDGWVMVPREPTRKMLDAFASAYEKDESYAEHWQRMIAAAPKPEVSQETFEQWLSKQSDGIDVDCGCVTTEAFYHWIRVAYNANR